MRYIAMVVAIVAATTSCTSPAEPDPEGSLSGYIVARDVQLSIGGPPSIHVKELGDECGCKYLIRSDTRIRRRTESGSLARATYADLAVGKRVRVWSGWILLSCPGQSGADTVEILP
jgi:hypothetical protein